MALTGGPAPHVVLGAVSLVEHDAALGITASHSSLARGRIDAAARKPSATIKSP